jgi:hypothetical protein
LVRGGDSQQAGVKFLLRILTYSIGASQAIDENSNGGLAPREPELPDRFQRKVARIKSEGI